MLESALKLAEKGFAVFPLKQHGKTPLTKTGFKEASKDPQQIIQWWTDHPSANIGIATGEASGVFVLDVDVKNDAGGMESFVNLQNEQGALPETITSLTWSGGMHLFFKHETGRKSGAGFRPGIDIRGDGGYIVAPPSRVEGKSYQWEVGSSPWDIQPATAPAWLVELKRKEKPSVTDNSPITQNRDNTLISIGGKLRSIGMTETGIYAELSRINQERCTPPLPDKDIKRISKSAANYDAGTPEPTILPIKKISEITYIPPTYLVEDLWIDNMVGFISASPGSKKTWYAWEIAVAVATGTKCLGVYNTIKSPVLAFNAEDSPGAITKARITALLSGRGLKPEDADLALIDVPMLPIDDPKMQVRIKETVEYYKPKLIILDPLRQLHSQNEDKASDMAPVLAFLRELQRETNCGILLVVHDRKGNGEEGRREDKTRGSNALEGWRDTAIYIDNEKDGKVKVQIYHRGYMAPKPFYFTLEVDNKLSDGVWHMLSAKLRYESAAELENIKMKEVCEMILEVVKKHGPISSSDVREMVGRRKEDVNRAISLMSEKLVLVKKSKKLVTGTTSLNFGVDFIGNQSGTTPF